MVLNSVIVREHRMSDEPLLSKFRSLVDPQRVEWIVLGSQHEPRDGTLAEVSGACGLNAAVRRSSGRNLIVLGRLGESFLDALPDVERFLADGGPVVGIGIGASDGAIGEHLERCEHPSALAFLFAASGRFCSLRSNFAARAPFDDAFEGAEAWLEFVYGHLCRCAQAGGGKGRNFWSNASLLPALDAMSAGWPTENLDPSAWDRFVRRRDLLELHLSRRLVRSHLEALDSDRRSAVERLGRIEAILRCSRDLIPTRQSFSFLLEAHP